MLSLNQTKYLDPVSAPAYARLGTKGCVPCRLRDGYSHLLCHEEHGFIFAGINKCRRFGMGSVVRVDQYAVHQAIVAALKPRHTTRVADMLRSVAGMDATQGVV